MKNEKSAVAVGTARTARLPSTPPPDPLSCGEGAPVLRHLRSSGSPLLRRWAGGEVAANEPSQSFSTVRPSLILHSPKAKRKYAQPRPRQREAAYVWAKLPPFCAVKEPNVDALVQQLLKHKLTLALAENCTCGLAAAQLAPATSVSAVLLGSVVTCHVKAKKKLLGVKKETLATYLAKRQQTTNEMALGLHRLLPTADVCVAVTGLCGPSASEAPDKPVGTGPATQVAQAA